MTSGEFLAFVILLVSVVVLVGAACGHALLAYIESEEQRRAAERDADSHGPFPPLPTTW